MNKFYNPENRTQNNKQFTGLSDERTHEFNRHYTERYILFNSK